MFPDDGASLGLSLLEPPVASEKGAVLLRYGPGDAVTTGEP